MKVWKAVTACVGGVSAGLLPYVYVVLRMPTAPYATVTFERAEQIWKFILRTNYADVGAMSGGKFWLLASLYQTALFDLGIATLALAGVGAIVVARKAPKDVRILSFGIFCTGTLSVVLAVVALRAVGYSDENAYLYRVYGLAGEAFAALAATVGVGIAWHASAVQGNRVLRYALAICVIVLPAISVAKAAPAVRLAADPFVDSWLRGTLEALPSRAVLVVLEDGQVSDTELFGLAYLQVAEGLRRDVTVVTDTGIRPFYRPALPAGEGRFSLHMQRRMLLEASLKDGFLQNRPLYTSFAPESVSKRAVSRATGYAFALGADADPMPVFSSFRIPADAATNYAAASIAAHLRYLEASRLNDDGLSKEAAARLLQAMNFDPVPQSSDYRGFILHRSATAQVER